VWLGSKISGRPRGADTREIPDGPAAGTG
jgi:hypothetical protein